MTGLNETDRIVLDLIQQDLSLTQRPFAALAQTAEMGETDFIRHCERLLAEGFIREISAIYNAKAMGYKSTLVALSSDNPDESARMINRHGGVSHNYYREFRFNIWFTLTIPAEEDFDAHIRSILPQQEHGRYRILESRQMFKRTVNLRHSSIQRPAPSSPEPAKAKALHPDRELVRALQEPFPLTEKPWKEIAQRTGRTEPELIEQIREMKDAGMIKRISGIIRHRKTGFTANGLACFRIDEERIESAGHRISGFQEVSHCYHRNVYPDWPYPLMAMTHGTSREACESTIESISRTIGAEKTLILFSTREYKKERVRYFQESSWLPLS